MHDKEVKQLCAVLILAAVVLGGIGWAMLQVEGGAAAFPPLALAVACVLTCLGLWLGAKRTAAVLVISATALIGGVTANRSETTPQAEAHTWSCVYPDTYFGRIQRAQCLLQLQYHTLWHLEQIRMAQQRQLYCIFYNSREWFWQGDSYPC